MLTVLMADWNAGACADSGAVVPGAGRVVVEWRVVVFVEEVVGESVVDVSVVVDG